LRGVCPSRSAARVGIFGAEILGIVIGLMSANTQARKGFLARGRQKLRSPSSGVEVIGGRAVSSGCKPGGTVAKIADAIAQISRRFPCIGGGVRRLRRASMAAVRAAVICG